MTNVYNRAARAVAQIERMRDTASTHDSDFARGQESGFIHALEVVRNELRPYLPGGIPNQPEGTDR